MNTGTIRMGAAVVLLVAMGCASSKTPADAPPPAGSTGAPAATGSATPAASNGPTAAPATPSAAPVASAAAPKERPFAHTALEAQSLIQEQIDDHMVPLLKCVNDFRQKKNDPHKQVVVDVGIDQEGILLGVTTPNIKKGDLDPVMRDCMSAALRGLPFPRSHAGIITVRQTFSDVVVQQ
jgi:hypothetical protein